MDNSITINRLDYFVKMHQNSFMFQQGPMTRSRKKSLSSITTKSSKKSSTFINQGPQEWPTWDTSTISTKISSKNQASKHNFTQLKEDTSVLVSMGQQPKYRQRQIHSHFRFLKKEKIYDNIKYERINEIPQKGFLGRGPTLYYKYYIDEPNNQVYFYAYQGMMKRENQKLAQKPNENELLKDGYFLRESVKIVPLQIAKFAFN